MAKDEADKDEQVTPKKAKQAKPGRYSYVERTGQLVRDGQPIPLEARNLKSLAAHLNEGPYDVFMTSAELDRAERAERAQAAEEKREARKAAAGG